MFKNVDKSMLMKLVLLHVVVIAVSNALVAIPVEIFGVKLTWAAFTFPLVVIATDLTVRLLGKHIARATIAAAYPLAIIWRKVNTTFGLLVPLFPWEYYPTGHFILVYLIAMVIYFDL